MQTNNKLREALTKILHLTNSLDENCAVDPVEIRDIARAALAAPARNCDKFSDVDVAYERFRSYVSRENPSFTKASPLHTVYDALKWMLDGEKKEADA